MGTRRRSLALDEPIAALLDETAEDDPREAVRVKARELVQLLVETCGGRPPFSMEALASLRGIVPSPEPPAFSPDAELQPDEAGQVRLRLNRDRPRTRQRFSIGHEISHTFFPGYEQKVQCRKPKGRDWADPEDVVEMLCDVGASELLFPLPWFEEDAALGGGTGAGLVSLAERYEASLEATLRRYVEIQKEPIAVVFCHWQLKPAQKRAGLGRADLPDLYGTDPAAEALTLTRLRVEYAVPSATFAYHIPADKSVDSATVIQQACQSSESIDGEEVLDLGPCRGRFRVSAIPLYTPVGKRGPNGESAVVAVIRPISTGARRPQAVPQEEGGELF
jgi:Zn-dependent peptidase ImmA (M78 family)